MILAPYKHRLWADTETRSRNDIKRGAYVYGEDSSLLLYMYALDEGPVNLWSPLEGQPMPRDLHDYLRCPEVELAFHNVDFDRTQMMAWGWWRYYDLNPYRFYCTMTHARMCSMPGSLDQWCKAVGMPQQYAKRDGDALIRMFCIPKKDRPADQPYIQPWEKPAEWHAFKEYGVMDVVAMREAARWLPHTYTHTTKEFFARTTFMNDRGVAIDKELVVSAHEQAEALKKFYKAEGQRLTGNYRMARKDGSLVKEFNIQSQQALLAYFKEYGIVLPDARINTIEKFLDTEQAKSLPPTMQKLLTTRLMANKSSVTKYKAINTGVNSDSRARGLISFYGAGRTGRDAGRRIQPQNLARPVIVGVEKDANGKIVWDMDKACDIVKRGLTSWSFEDPMQVLSDCVRGSITAAPGHHLAVADLSNIEGRGLPWLAGEDWKIQYFRDYDNKLVKFDNYVIAYAKAFNIDPATVDKIQRGHGKVIELACMGPDTLVVTDSGAKRIVDVRLQDKLWDGHAWVSHSGVVFKGIKDVICLDKVWMTPDHLVRTGKSWTQACELDSNASTANQARATGSESLRLLRLNANKQAVLPAYAFNVPAARLTSLTFTTYSRVNQHGVTCVLSKRLVRTSKCTTGTPTLFPMTHTVDGCSTASRRASRAVTALPRASTTRTGAEESTYTNRGGEAKMGAGRFCSTSSNWTGGTTPRWNLIERTITTATPQATYVSYRSAQTSLTVVQSDNCKTNSPKRMPTYDVLNVGSRNCFTVLSSKGAFVVHNCGYGGGVGGFMAFAAVYRTDLKDIGDAILATAPPDEYRDVYKSYDWYKSKGLTYGLQPHEWAGCMYLVKAWRKAHPNIVALWKRCQEAFVAAIRNPGIQFPMARGTYAINVNGWVFVYLPSGRPLVYPHATVEGEGYNQIVTFMGVNSFTKQWGVNYTMGSRLAENITQAFAADCLFWNIPAIENAGYPIVLRVHDELVTEPVNDGYHTGARLAQMMSQTQYWCPDLPLAAVGEDLLRYQK